MRTKSLTPRRDTRVNNNGKLRIATETPSSTCRTLSQPLANHDSPPRFEIITARQASRVPEFAGGDQTPLPVLSPPQIQLHRFIPFSVAPILLHLPWWKALFLLRFVPAFVAPARLYLSTHLRLQSLPVLNRLCRNSIASLDSLK